MNRKRYLSWALAASLSNWLAPQATEAAGLVSDCLSVIDYAHEVEVADFALEASTPLEAGVSR